ncbi:GntR family transcriptional regulator [uncultured Ligilactobacillus sp.]|uniref:GntR family transcriptional regulator n=1 Tax=uncultured Ligilactobacillus sp. TaxID=2837633 RepID=UPI0025827748|nr:GntR family transcriptional regulator [uncultured Ligilactobacillus sp.]
MHFKFTGGEPIYIQIASQLEEAIFTGVFSEGEQIPSTTEISRDFHINPATVLKGMNILVEAGLIEKRRGIGMFVANGSQTKLTGVRREQFYKNYVESMISEAKKLGISKGVLQKMIEKGWK